MDDRRLNCRRSTMSILDAHHCLFEASQVVRPCGTARSVSVYSRGDSKAEHEGCNILQIVFDFPSRGETPCWR